MGVRVDATLLRDAAQAAGLGDVRPSYVIRYALAVLAGRADPVAEAHRVTGPPRGYRRTAAA